MEKQKPGIKRACEYLDLIKQSNVSLLPSIRSLAKTSGVSFVTMWKALKYLEETGEIVSDSQGNRSFYSNKPLKKKDEEKTVFRGPQSLSKQKGSSAWQYVTEKLYKDIVTGRYSGSTRLPSCKELQRLYGVSFATMKKSLEILVEQRIIESQNKNYFIPSLTGSTGHARIVAIGCGWEDGKIWVDYQDKSYFRTLESECMKMNIQLDLIVYYREHGRMRFVHTGTRKEYDLSDRSILGYIFVVANLDGTPKEVLDRLSRLGRSVAVLDVVGGWQTPRSISGNRMVQFFTATASAYPAKRVAQYMLGKGHRKIAFISPFHRALWSQQRFDTISEMYERAGIENGVVPFVYSDYAYKWDYLKNGECQEDLRELVNQYQDWKKEANEAFLRRFGNLGYNLVKYFTERNCASGEIFEKMKPMFDKALEDRSITAWVIANDFAATIAIDYLKERNIHIPDDLSVISFDNTLDAMENYLTSYDFNNHGIISLILRFILAPHTVKTGRNGKCIEVEGNLVIRRSC